MPIWKRSADLDTVNGWSARTRMRTLDIRITEIGDDNLRAVREGTVTGTARPLHIGRSTQVWEIRIENAAGALTCTSRLTMAVVPQRAVMPRP